MCCAATCQQFELFQQQNSYGCCEIQLWRTPLTSPPTSQDILTSGHHNVINTETAVACASGNCEVVAVRREMGKQLARGWPQRLYVRRGIVCCVCRVIYTYTRVVSIFHYSLGYFMHTVTDVLNVKFSMYL